MKGYKNVFSRDYAVSEIVGGMFLVLLAVVAFSAIYMTLFPPAPDLQISVKIVGDVNDAGLPVLYNDGGKSVTDYNIIMRDYPNGALIGSAEIKNDHWAIGTCRYPLELININNIQLINETDMLEVVVYNINSDGTQYQIFSGILNGKTPFSQPQNLTGDSMLISSLKTDTTDEDLICFNNTINPAINAVSYIYNWLLDGNSINYLFMPFDINNPLNTKDYSGNNNNGTVNGATWNSNGVVSGAYQFDGIDDYISLPYCFDGNYLDKVTFETWVKTSYDSGVISSYGRNKIYELLLDEGRLRWFTYTMDEGQNEIGVTTNVADNLWHHIATTYDYETGNSAIFIDGELETSGNTHAPNSFLGNGENPTGLIGTTNSGPLPGEWSVLAYDDFEYGFGHYTDGGRDCTLYTYGTYAHQGTNAADIQDNNEDSSAFYLTNGIDVRNPGYTSIKVEFWFYSRGLSYGEDFWLKYYDGSSWRIVADYNKGVEFENNIFYHKTVWINKTNYNFPTNMRIKFECSAGSDDDDIYIDEVYINATSGNKEIDNFIGLIDELHIYNRVLSDEQIYQNYLCTKDGHSDKSVIVSEETIIGNIWNCIVTPNDTTQDDDFVESNLLQIMGYGGG
jgi:hypothetical protein